LSPGRIAGLSSEDGGQHVILRGRWRDEVDSDHDVRTPPAFWQEVPCCVDLDDGFANAFDSRQAAGLHL